MNPLDSVVQIEPVVAQGRDLIGFHFGGQHKFAQRRAVVAGRGVSVDKQ